MTVTPTASPQPATRWWRKISATDWLAIAALIVSIWALIVTMHHSQIASDTLGVALRGVQYHNAISILDQSFDAMEKVRKQKNYQSVLFEQEASAKEIADVEEALEAYQSLIFKSALLFDRGLMPNDIWAKFLDDFCTIYRKYSYIKGWWGRQRGREPYEALSQTYRELSFNCQKLGGGPR